MAFHSNIRQCLQNLCIDYFDYFMVGPYFGEVKSRMKLQAPMQNKIPCFSDLSSKV